MSEFSEEPRFTIEQIDLLQRLRRSGMNKQEILLALETLDRLDREHGDKFGRRTSSSSSSSSCYGVGGANNCTNNSASNTTTSLNNNNTASATTTSSVTCNGNTSGEGDRSAPAASSTTSKMSTATQTQFGSAGGHSPSPSNSYNTSPPPGPPPPSAILPSPVSLVAHTQNGRDSLAATPNGKLSPPRYPVNSAAAARAFGFEATEEDLDIDDKVEELMR
ncbi:Homeobox-containing protein 1 [Dissostichus eleginoides]|uniref:Homeobox-containing protein 1 n=1 Tax=Dissostichus eleginoides TaxID=100907 RepID=A0AAD9BUD4_DISEL|nr:Homeobox-containing protein 1 [Dissostichus eleginoides]